MFCFVLCFVLFWVLVCFVFCFVLSCLVLCCLFVCVRYDCHSALHCAVQYTESTALPNSGLAQGTGNSTDAVRRCTVTDRLA